jgi:tetratricopeptide (TPR) repeat protein
MPRLFQVDRPRPAAPHYERWGTTMKRVAQLVLGLSLFLVAGCAIFPSDQNVYDQGEKLLRAAEQLRKAGQTDEAIAKLNTILAPDGRFGWSKEDIKRAYGPLKYYACAELTRCYIAKGDLVKAVEYLDLAENRYPYVSSCATCNRIHDRRLAELKDELAKKQQLQH